MSLLSLNILVDDLLMDKIGNASGFPIKLNHIIFFFFKKKIKLTNKAQSFFFTFSRTSNFLKNLKLLLTQK